MLKALIDFLLNRKGHPAQKYTTLEAQAPYKVEVPAPEPKVEVRSDAGTWPFPTAVVEEKPVKPAVKAKSTRAKKAPAAAITVAEKPKKAPAKPRAKKAKE